MGLNMENNKMQSIKKIAIRLSCFLMLCIMAGCILWNTTQQISEIDMGDSAQKGDISVTYDYEGDEVGKIVLCTNAGVLPTDWYESSAINGKNKKFTITLLDITMLSGLMLEMRGADAEKNFTGQMNISEIAFYINGETEIISFKGDDLKRLIEGNTDANISWDEQQKKISWKCCDASMRLYFLNTEIENIAKYVSGDILQSMNKKMYLKDLAIIILLCIIFIIGAILSHKRTLRFNFSLYLFMFFSMFFWIFAVHNKVNVFEYDSDFYWYLGGRAVQQGDITLYTFPDTYRGYVFPLFLGISKHIGCVLFSDPILGYLLCESMIASLLVAIILPSIVTRKSRVHHVVITSFCAILIVYFWSSFLVYPLTDLFAFTLYVGGIALLMDIYRRFVMGIYEKGCWWYYFAPLLAGGLLYSAYNCRTVYGVPSVLVVIVVIIGILMSKCRKKKGRLIICCVIASIIGFLAVGLPQSVINNRFHDRITPAVLTEYTFGSDLSVLQLFAGIPCNRYETLSQSCIEEVGTSILYYPNLEGQQIMMQEVATQYNLSNYIKLVFKYPFKFIRIYIFHFVNGLSPIFRDVYIKDIHISKMVPLVIVLTMVVLIVFITLRKQLKWDYEHVFRMATIFPALIIIPGQMETRFMLPMAIMMYAYVAHGIGFQFNDMKSMLSWEGVKILGVCILVVAMWITILATTLASVLYR